MFGWLLDSLGWSPFARFTRLATSSQTGVRALAAAGLGEVAEARAVVALVGLLADHEPAVQAAARASLAKLGATAMPALLVGLKDARDPVARQSAEVLGGSAHADAVAPLLHALMYANRPVQLAARRSLEQLGALAVPALEAARGEPQPWVKRQVEEALGAIRGA